jgi:hypothetical protein
MPAIIKGPRRFGPFRGVKSVTGARSFAGGNISTNLRVPQVLAEAWVQDTPVLRVPNAAIEPWVQDNPELRVLQVVLEVWGLTALATIVVQPRAELGPRGLLGIPPRRFRERSVPTVAMRPPTTGIPAFLWVIT